MKVAYQLSMALVGMAALAIASPAHAIILEDGEGDSAALNGKYTKFNNANRVAQLTTENGSILPVAGSGAAKYAFNVDGSFFASRFNHAFASPLDIGPASTGALDLSFYYTGANFNDRSSGKTLDTIAFYFGDGIVEQGVKITVVDREGATAQVLHNLQADGWNTFHLELDQQGRFTAVGSTINGLPVQTSSANLASTFATSGWGTDEQVAAMWAGLTSYDIADEHGGNGGSGNYEGFYAIDGMQFTPVPEPTVLLPAALTMLVMGRRRVFQRPLA